MPTETYLSPPAKPKHQRVVITDIRMPLLSMVIFMVKWAIAAIPAIITLWLIGIILYGVLMAMPTMLAIL